LKQYILIFLLIINIIFIPGCRKENSKKPSIFYNLQEEPAGLDPQIVNDYSSNILILNLFEGLVKLDENGEAMPAAAESWESQNNNKVFIFHIKENLKWANDVNLTAEDFLYGLKRAISPRTFSCMAKKLYCIKNARDINQDKKNIEKIGVYALDEKTLKIELEYSMPDFPKLMAIPAAMPCNKDFFSVTSGQYGKETDKILTNGPFKINGKNGWNHNKSINLVINENYHNKENINISGVKFYINKDIDTLQALENKTLDACNVNFTDIKKIKEKNFNLKEFKNATWGLIFNCSDFSENIFKNENIRKAFLSSIDREHITSGFLKENTDFTLTNDILLDNMELNGKNYRELSGKNLFFKRTESPKNLLNSGLKELNKTELPSDIKILYLDEPSVCSMMNNLIENLNSSLGHYFNIEAVSYTELENKIKNNEYQMAFAPLRAKSKDPVEFINYFKSDFPKNPVKLNSKEYDDILRKIENSSEIHADFIQEAEKFLNNHAIFYPICTESQYFAFSKKVNNIIFHPFELGVDFTGAEKVS